MTCDIQDQVIATTANCKYITDNSRHQETAPEKTYRQVVGCPTFEVIECPYRNKTVPKRHPP
jgi:hypothetical protein